MKYFTGLFDLAVIRLTLKRKSAGRFVVLSVEFSNFLYSFNKNQYLFYIIRSFNCFRINRVSLIFYVRAWIPFKIRYI